MVRQLGLATHFADHTQRFSNQVVARHQVVKVPATPVTKPDRHDGHVRWEFISKRGQQLVRHSTFLVGSLIEVPHYDKRLVPHALKQLRKDLMLDVVEIENA